MHFDRWRRVWAALGVARVDDGLHRELVDRYTEPRRHYHTMQHLSECFVHLDDLHAEAERPAEIEMALWFHDAIYDTHNHDNEERSAQWARSCLRAAGVSGDVAERVFALVLATQHDAVPSGSDAIVLVDIDLAILGAEPARFDEYEAQVRAEYAWVPPDLYRRERGKVLQSFSDRSAIYGTRPFSAGREARARANIARSLTRLQASSGIR